MAKRKPGSRSTEVDAYIFIKENLRELGWDCRNPSRVPSGRVYTQNECLEHPEIQKQLGAERPENVVMVADSVLWVIEAKRSQGELAKAVREAEAYARAINRSSNLKALFISGVAGNEGTGYLTQTLYLVGNTYRPVTFNGKEASALLPPNVAARILHEGPDIEDVPVDETLFLLKAERINEHLHLGAINKNQRARVMAALLLSLIEETPPNVNAAPSVLVAEINARAERVLKQQKKSDFFQYIQIGLPPAEDNHSKFKTAIVRTIQELNNLNIRSAMNSGTDVLGKFYEVFLKYGNGAKEIGIVLTPRHITRFAVDVLGVTSQDVVYDPTCGTGGFLVAAFDQVKKTIKGAALERFKQNNLYGVEQEAEVVALALVNMIFRGDGKNNIIEGSCFQKHIIRGDKKPVYANAAPSQDDAVVTRVLMNPPFALKASDEKEFRFVDQALSQMQDHGLLFAVLPYSAMVKPGAYRTWRESLLRTNTLLGVLTLPPDLFYPVGVHTVGIVVRKGVPHPREQSVLWVRAINDGMLKSKGKRLPNPRAADDFATVLGDFKAFVANPSHPVASESKLKRACPVSFEDPLFELVPENYLEEPPPTEAELERGIERVLRDTLAFLVNEGGDR